MKKLLALTLSLIMVLSMGTSVFAYSDVEEGTYVSEAVTVLSNLDILNGYTDGSFKPDAVVTRAEMAKIICEMLGYDKVSKSTTIFTDVPADHWASGYINAANAFGIIVGYGNGEFGPEDTVTYNQAAKMIICALGYDVICDTYPTSYLTYANSLKLFTNVNGNGEIGATRGNIATLVYNALDAAMLVQTGFGTHNEYRIVEDDTILSTKLKIAKVKGTIDSIDFKDNEAVVTVITADKSFDEIESGSYETAIDLTAYKNIMCEIYIDVEDEIIVAVTGDKKADYVTIDNKELFVEYDNGKFVYYKDVDSTKTSYIRIDSDIAAYVNNSVEEVELADYTDKFDSITFIDADDDGKYETAIIEIVEAFVVKSVNPRTMTIVADTSAGRTFNKAKLVLDEDKITWTIDTDLEDINVGDVVNIKTSEMVSGTHYDIYVTDTKIEGYVNSTRDDVYYIDGEEYYAVSGVSIKLGTTGIFTLDMMGNIIAVDTTVTASSAKWGYVLYTGVRDGFDEDEYRVKLVTTTGAEKIYDFATKVRINGDSAVKTEDIFEDELADLTGLVGYKLNNNDEISAIYTDFDEIDVDYNTTNGGTLKVKADGRLGSYYTSNDVIIFNVDGEDVTIQPVAGLLEDNEYTIAKLVYDSATNELVIAVGINVTADADPSSPVMLVKSIAYGIDDVIIVDGYVDGELVEIKYDSYELDDVTEPVIGDLLQYTIVDGMAIGIANLGNVKSIPAASMSAFDTQDEGLFIHKGRVDNIRGVNVEFFNRDSVSMPGSYATYRFANDKIYTDELIEDITFESLRGDDEAIEYLVVVKYDNVPLIAVIVEK